MASNKSKKNACADTAISFILAADNVAFLSWGSKRIKVDGVKYEVPSILRKKSVSLMFDQYKVARQDNPALKRSTFYKLCSVLTHGTVQSRRAVDYVTGILVNDTMDMMNRVIVAFLPEVAENLARDLQLLKAWLKYGSFSDVDVSRQDDAYVSVQTCPRHQADFGLALPSPDNPKQNVGCSAYTSMKRVTNGIFEQLKSAQASEEALSVVTDCYEKFDLFMGHRLRVVNQQRALHELFQNIKERCIDGTGSNEILLVIDFKMKVEPLYFREKTTDHYGKRGMTWHGAMARIWSLESNDESDDLVPVENKVYFDHISAGDNKQDREAVVAYMEAIILSIKRDLPKATNITVQSDNATSYQNAFVALMIPVLASAYGVNICRFIHTETQDGKSMLDAHFAQGMRKVKAWVQQGHDCYTPRQLVAALGADGGLFNSIGELVEYKREATADLRRQIAPMEKSFSKLIGRVNDLFYEYTLREGPGNMNDNVSTVVDSTSSGFSLNDSVNFSVRAFAYSGIGDGTHIVIDSQTLKCSLKKNSSHRSGWTTTELTDQRASTEEDAQDDGALELLSSADHEATTAGEEYLSGSDLSDSDECVVESEAAIVEEENSPQL